MNAVIITPDHARCLACGYALRGLPENRCPECGNSFDPANGATMNLGRRLPTWAGDWLRPPASSLNVSALAVLGLAILAASGPGRYFWFEILFGLAGSVVGMRWILRIIVRLVLAAFYRQPLRRDIRALALWLVAPLVALLTAATLMSNAPLYVTFTLSKPFLEARARRALACDYGATDPGWVGLFYMSSIETYAGGVKMQVAGAGSPLDDEGFAYFPGRAAPNDYLGCRHFSGDWHLWSWSFFD